MKSSIIGLLAETSLHPGTESNTGVVDLPVAREAATGYPVVVGSSLKGALRDMSQQAWSDPGKNNDDPRLGDVFGQHDSAGAVAVTDARLLLLPVRSLTGHYKWLTCPYLLERYKRDRELAGLSSNFTIPRPEKETVVAKGQGQLFLEELSFSIVDGDLNEVINYISPLIYHQSVRDRLPGQLAIMSDDEFVYFARYGLQVNARNVLDEAKRSKNLWYEETIPPDSLFYSLLLSRLGKEKELMEVRDLFVKHPYLQVGGNETIGQGWCVVSWVNGGVGKNE